MTSVIAELCKWYVMVYDEALSSHEKSLFENLLLGSKCKSRLNALAVVDINSCLHSAPIRKGKKIFCF